VAADRDITASDAQTSILRGTLQEALDQGLVQGPAVHVKPWEPDPIDPQSLQLLEQAGPSSPRREVEDERDNTGRATSRQFYRDSISFTRRVPSTPDPTQWYELSRFITRRGEIGVIRLLWTWLDLIGAPWSPGFGNPAVSVHWWNPVDMKALLGYSFGLPGLPTQYYTPFFLVGCVTAETGALAGNLQIRLGTTAGGDEIMSDRVLVGFNQPGAQFTIPLAGLVPPINAAATLFLTVTAIDTGVATGTAHFDIYGSTVSPGAVVPIASGSPCGIDPVGPIRQGVDVLWSLQFEQLAGRPMAWTVPVVHQGFAVDWPGLPWPNIDPWRDDRYAWGTPAGNVFFVVPEDTIVRLCFHMDDNDAIAYLGWVGGRLQGYTQPASSPAAVHNVRHGWGW
jgi:hypothetical protein